MNDSQEERTIEPFPGIDLTEPFQRLFEALFGTDFESTAESVVGFWNVLSVFSILLALLFIAGFVYAKIRLSQLSDIENQLRFEAEAAWAHTYGGAVSENNKWADIQKHISSDNPNDWRLAIIEADILLEETLSTHGYVGTTIGEMLKSANSSAFRTLQDAWSAHKVRNQIAHSGSDFVLTKKMANDTILQFERVFREFQVI